MVWGHYISVFDLFLTAECIFLSICRPRGHRQISNAQNWGDLGTVERLTVCVLWPLQPRGEHSWITYRNKWGTNWLSQSWAAAQADGGNQRLPLLMEMRRTQNNTCAAVHTTPLPLSGSPPPNITVCLTLCHRGSWVHSTRTCCSFLPWALRCSANTRGVHSDSRLSLTSFHTPTQWTCQRWSIPVTPRSILHYIYICSPACCKILKRFRTPAKPDMLAVMAWLLTGENTLFFCLAPLVTALNSFIITISVMCSVLNCLQNVCDHRPCYYSGLQKKFRDPLESGWLSV